MTARRTWRDMDTAARERAYSPSSCIGGNYQPYLQTYAERSAQARAALPHQSLRYGPGDTQALDLFLPPAQTTGASLPPLLVFIHGGYWQALSRAESAFAAADCVAQGIAHAVIDYTLAPHATLPQIVAECRLAVRWLHRQAASLGFDASRIVVAGSSAGAHLAAMVALPGPADTSAAHAVQATVLVSGIFELAPLLGTSINQALGLTLPVAQAMSPALQPLSGMAPGLVAWGEVETDEFKRQAQDFADDLQAAGTHCQRLAVPGRNHFDVILDLAKPGTLLGQAVLALLLRA